MTSLNHLVVNYSLTGNIFAIKSCIFFCNLINILFTQVAEQVIIPIRPLQEQNSVENGKIYEMSNTILIVIFNN